MRECVNELILSKTRAGKSDRYLRQLRVSLSSFAKGRWNVDLKSLQRIDVEKWLFSREWSPRTQRGYLADLRTLINFAVRRGYLEKDFITWIELPEDQGKYSSIHLHTPAEVQTVLETARKIDLDTMRRLAIRYFAGIRSAEALRLREENILETGFIEVPVTKSKTRRRRLVKIQPNLAAWLALGGTLRPMGEKAIRSVITLSGVPWSQNVTRHSFVSYHYAAFESAAKTAMEAGHSEPMLFAHYRALVTKEKALEFWEVLPEPTPRTKTPKQWGGPRMKKP